MAKRTPILVHPSQHAYGAPIEFAVRADKDPSNVHGQITLSRKDYADPTITAHGQYTATLNRVPIEFSCYATYRDGEWKTGTSSPRRTDGDWTKPFGFERDLSSSIRDQAKAIAEDSLAALLSLDFDIRESADAGFRHKQATTRHATYCVTTDLSQGIETLTQGIRDVMATQRVQDPNTPISEAMPSRAEVRQRVLDAVAVMYDALDGDETKEAHSESLSGLLGNLLSRNGNGPAKALNEIIHPSH